MNARRKADVVRRKTFLHWLRNEAPKVDEKVDGHFGCQIVELLEVGD